MTNFTQLIDFEGNLLCTTDAWLKEQALENVGFDYSVVTVLGCQSSGKSTLLNQLFGTSFVVMDASQGRQQTTKGLWLARDKSSNTLIIDVEGTDSKERGEDRLTFEHRAALFSLAVADCVIVNMWYHDLGRYTASNYGLLKTVFGVNLELFQQEKSSLKTIMLFVIRDYSELLTPLNTLNKMIQDDIRTIWKDITKPDHLNDSLADDFFIFKTVGLPSKIDHPEPFQLACTNLRNIWLKECRPSSYSRQVPADGFSFYASNVWDTIKTSSELDIPSQKEMLATYRCEEIKSAAFSQAAISFPECLRLAQKALLPLNDFSWAVKIIEEALDLYDGPAGRYQLSVYRKKRLQLIQSLQQELQKIVDINLTHIRHRVALDASVALDLLFPLTSITSEKIRGIPVLEAWAQFAETTDRWREDSLETMDRMTSTLRMPSSSSRDNDVTEAIQFNTSHARQALKEALEAILLRMREKQHQLFDSILSQTILINLGEFEIFFLDPDLSNNRFWQSIHNAIISSQQIVKKELSSAFMGLQTSINANEEHWRQYVSRAIITQTHVKLQRICDWLPNYIFARFEQFFERDEHDVPRQWQNLSSDKIKEIYLNAREKALVIFELFHNLEEKAALIAPNDSELQKLFCNVTLMPDAKEQQLFTKANRQMLKACQEAQLLQATGGKGTQIPWWIWVLLLAFGYNEISMVLFSPITLIFVCFALIIGAVSYYTGNMQLPLKLSRQIVGMAATTLIPVLSSLQQGPETVSVPARVPKPEVKTEDE